MGPSTRRRPAPLPPHRFVAACATAAAPPFCRRARAPPASVDTNARPPATASAPRDPAPNASAGRSRPGSEPAPPPCRGWKGRSPGPHAPRLGGLATEGGRRRGAGAGRRAVCYERPSPSARLRAQSPSTPQPPAGAGPDRHGRLLPPPPDRYSSSSPLVPVLPWVSPSTDSTTAGPLGSLGDLYVRARTRTSSRLRVTGVPRPDRGAGRSDRSGPRSGAETGPRRRRATSTFSCFSRPAPAEHLKV